MGDLNIILLVQLVWTFTAVCKAYDSLSITCEDVTGHVGDKLTLTCRVSYEDNTNCMRMYRFMNKDKGTETCKENFTSVPCEQLTSISCPYTTNEVTTTTFKVFIQTRHSAKSAEFTVNTAGALKHADETVSTEDNSGKTGNTVLVVTIVVICLIIMIAVGLILRRKYNCTNILQRDYDLGEREENNKKETEL